jgi:hypothetical protein
MNFSHLLEDSDGTSPLEMVCTLIDESENPRTRLLGCLLVTHVS